MREDRLSTPLTGIYDEKSGTYYTVLRTDTPDCEALACHNYGEVILSGKTSLGFTGFRNADAHAALVFGFPYCEAPKSYIRKLTLAPAVQAFEKLEKGETRRLTWTIRKGVSPSYSAFVAEVWNDSFDALDPRARQPALHPRRGQGRPGRIFHPELRRGLSPEIHLRRGTPHGRLRKHGHR